MSAARGADGASAPRAAFPWTEAAGLAFGLLRWSPRDFWRATPRELALALAPFRPGGLGGAPDRAALEALIRRFPDEE